MDSDGTANKSGNSSFANTNKKIIDGICLLIVSLGEKYKLRSRIGKCNGKAGKVCWTVSFTPSFNAFRLNRKLSRQKKSAVRLNKFRYIIKAKRVKAIPTKCIQVSSSDHLFLAGNQMIPTHNSMMLSNMAIQMWMQKNTIDTINPTKGHNVLYFSLEMPYAQCFRRTMARLSRISTYALRDCQITNEKKLEDLSKAANFVKRYEPEFEIVDIPRGVTVKQIEDRYLEAVAKGHRPDVVVVDYLGLMNAPEKDGDDWLRLGYIAGSLHEFARVYNVVVLTAVQLNRPKSKDRNDIIGLQRIGRSNSIMDHATLAIQIETRPDECTYPDMPYHIIKNRNGELGDHYLKKMYGTATLIDGEPKKMADDSIGEFTAANTMEDLSDKFSEYGWV